LLWYGFCALNLAVFFDNEGGQKMIKEVFVPAVVILLAVIVYLLHPSGKEEKGEIHSVLTKKFRSKLSVLERVALVIEDYFSVSADRITSEMLLFEVFDSYTLGDITGITELAIGLEDEFEILISDEDATLWETVEDVCTYIEERLGESNS